MCFDKFLFWVESRDLSQADNSIIRVSSFPSWVMGSRTFFSVSTTEPWTFCKMNALNPLKFTSHKKNWENWGKKLKLIKTSILPNFQVPNSLFFCKIIKKIIHFIQRKKTLLYYSCQLEIDHMTQLKKETCQSTCNGPSCSSMNSTYLKLEWKLFKEDRLIQAFSQLNQLLGASILFWK